MRSASNGRSGEKAETRARILRAAGALFRRHGIDAVGVDAVMREAGLTHGGFYGHFSSKEALAADVCAGSLARSATRWAAIADSHGKREALERIVRAYLDPAQLEAGEHGCVLPMLGPELARRAAPRPALTEAIGGMIEVLARCLPRRRRPARERAMAGLAAMVGAVVLARLSSDPALAREILAAARNELIPPEGS